MSMEAITAATAALTAAAEAFDGKIGEIDQALADFTASVNAGIAGAMRFRATVDPDLPISDPNALDFQTLKEALDAAPAGADVEIRIPAGRTVILQDEILMVWPTVRFIKDGAGLNPVLQVSSYVNGSAKNTFYRFVGLGNPSILFREVDIQMADKADPAEDWTSGAHFIGLRDGGGGITLGVKNCAISGPAGVFLMSAKIGGAGTCSIESCTVDAVQVLGGTTLAVYLLSASTVTLENGATFYGGGATQANIVENLINITEVP